MQNVQQRSFLGALASAIVAICSMIVNLVSAADKGIAMLDKTIVAAQEKQVVDLKIDMDDYAGEAMKRASLKAAQATQEIEAALVADASGQLRKLYDAKHTHLKTIIDEELTKLRASRNS